MFAVSSGLLLGDSRETEARSGGGWVAPVSPGSAAFLAVQHLLIFGTALVLEPAVLLLYSSPDVVEVCRKARFRLRGSLFVILCLLEHVLLDNKRINSQVHHG